MNSDYHDASCCCGHMPSQHLFSEGMCIVCRRACEKFHRPGEGHVWANIVLVALVVAVVVAVCAGAWAGWLALAHGGLTWRF